LSSVRYLVAMFRLSRNHSAPADGIMRSCWRSFCGIHLNDQVTPCMTSQTALWIYASPCSCVLAESQCKDLLMNLPEAKVLMAGDTRTAMAMDLIIGSRHRSIGGEDWFCN